MAMLYVQEFENSELAWFGFLHLMCLPSIAPRQFGKLVSINYAFTDEKIEDLVLSKSKKCLHLYFSHPHCPGPLMALIQNLQILNGVMNVCEINHIAYSIGPQILNDGLRTIGILDSEQSDECIDFTMMYVFFLCLCYSITSRNNASISNFGDGFDGKFSRKSRKTGIFTQNQFSTESIFLYGCNSKTNHCKYLKFSPNTENFNIYANFFLKCRVDNIFLAQSKYLNILYKVPHMHNFFLLAFEVQIVTKIRQNHEYLQIILLTNHLRSESFFVYNDTYHCIQNKLHV
ncbi:hypothetical protein AGLY_016522 [Aphis glycines]|uniref:Uncharacterized protein n=1 Tax=Aphis glycines TaxID=307491 RepID=A0A6G0SZH2_APHGL|nr:hypothetical protein AGLY_016522 [Aphis glycines]